VVGAVYVTILPLTKISILFFYLRVFPVRSVKIGAQLLIALNVGYLLAFLLSILFRCRPISGAWLTWDEQSTAICINYNVQSWAAAIANMVFDIAVMVLPLREIAKLNMSRRTRSYLACVFCLGILYGFLDPLPSPFFPWQVRNIEG
jgi:hypothetical protein